MQNYNTTNLLNLKGVFVTEVIHYDKHVEIFIKTKVKPHICPVYGDVCKFLKSIDMFALVARDFMKSLIFFLITIE